ncbi:MAG: YfiT family bacillithiol transferase [Vicinamibacterales bacterium]
MAPERAIAVFTCASHAPRPPARHRGKTPLQAPSRNARRGSPTHASAGPCAASFSSVRRGARSRARESCDTSYRPGGWTVRQVVPHLPDSHLHAYARFKLSLTEDEPTIKPYDEGRWAELSDVRLVAPEVSLDLLEALHQRWVALLKSLGPADYRRTFRHPEFGRALTLEETLARYAWHGRHHVAHITSLRQRQGWS